MNFLLERYTPKSRHEPIRISGLVSNRFYEPLALESLMKLVFRGLEAFELKSNGSIPANHFIWFFTELLSISNKWIDAALFSLKLNHWMLAFHRFIAG